MIEIRGLQVRKKGRTICSVPQLAVATGERVAILGSNGSGKTTLLRVLAGLERAYEGQCIVEPALAERVYVHQSPYLFRGSVLSNVTYGLRARRFSGTQCKQRANQWLERLGLGKLAHSSVSGLSGGERRRVALARAMVLEPRLLLLDEPLADMDEAGAAAVAEAFGQLDQSTIVVASPMPLPRSLTPTSFTLDCRFPAGV